MTYTLDWLLDRVARGERVKYLFFWSHQPANSGQLTAACFSQWWPASFEVAGTRYATAEHWMMAQKARLFGNEEIVARIIAARTPAEAKQSGRLVRGFDEATWNAHRFDIVVRGNLEKFGQNAALRDFLLNTKDRVLVEASPVDPVWGIGLAADDERASRPDQWRGLNLLGFALMEVRNVFRSASVL